MAQAQPKISFIQLVALFGVLVLGVFLRVYQLGDQIITGDEWHALHIAMQADYSEIATSFGDADHSIPVALYFKLLMESVGLQQWMIQAPFVLAGCLLIFIIPWLLREQLGHRSAIFAAGLFAISPILITQARFARPYPIALLLSFVAVIYFYRWWKSRAKTDGAVYLLCAALTGYLLILNLPFVLGAFGYVFVCSLYSANKFGDWQQCRKDVRDLLLLGLATLLLLTIMLLPPLLGDFSALSEKAAGGMLGISSFAPVIAVFSGAGGALLTGAVLLVAGLGLATAVQRRIKLLGLLGFLAILQGLAVAIANPVGTENIVIIARYLVPLLAFLLILTALGLDRLVGLIDATINSGWSYGLYGLLLLVAVVLGPLPRAYYSPNNNIVLMTISEMVLDMPSYEAMLSKPVAGFYTDQEELPAAQSFIVQAPYYYNFDYLPVYQHLTGQRIAMGMTDGLCSSDRQGEIPIALRDNVSLNNYFYLGEPVQIREAGVDYVAFHHNLEQEVLVPVIVEEMNVQECISAYQNWFGEPVYADNKITVFAIN